MSDILQALRAMAMRFPGASEGIACEGTALEKHTIKVKNKAFLFFGKADVMVKLGPSAADARRLSEEKPGRLKIGANGWATLQLGEEPPPLDLLEKWVEESYRLLASKDLIALLDRGPGAAAPPATSKRRAKTRPSAPTR